MAYPEKVTDLKPDQRVSAPVVLIDYDLLKGCPVEVIDAVHDLVDAYENAGGGVVPRDQTVAYRRPLTGEELDRALLRAQQDWIRLSDAYEQAISSRDVSARTLFDRFRLHEINTWAVKENKPPIPLREDA